MAQTEKVNILMVDDQPGKLLSYEAILSELGEKALHMALVEREEHLFLAREVEVHRALGHARLVGDFRDARHAVRVLQVQGLYRVQDFLAALRAALRQDPDVILIGEMRDTETVRAALQAAETGHLVLSTLHTTDATETVNRVIDFFPPYQQKQVRLALAASLRGIVCQRLVPTVDGGRVPALEILVNTGRVAERIEDPDTTSEIKDVIKDGAFYGMVTFDQWLLRLIQEGTVSVADAMQAVSSRHDFELAMQQAGIAVPA